MSTSSNWVMEMETLLESTDEREYSETNSTCIFGLADPLLKRKPEAYIPQVISIGPYHHNKLDKYKETDTYKAKMARTMEKKITGFMFDRLRQEIKNMVTEVRAYYDRDIPYDDDVLSLMLALDASFLIQFLRSTYSIYCEKQEGHMELMEWDPILHSKRKTPLWYAIQSDIFMLENQVPICLLAKVFDVTNQHGNLNPEVPQHASGGELADILHAACCFFNPFSPGTTSPKPDITKTRHILEYLHHCINFQSDKKTLSPKQGCSVVETISSLSRCCGEKPQEEERGRFPLKGFQHIIRLMLKKISPTRTGGSLPSTIELRRAGVKFKPCSSTDMREIQFDRRSSTLFLPEISINDSTEVVLRNLVALELYLDPQEKPITRYTYLMDRLIDTPEDVAVLKRCRIINSQMGSDTEVARMWNSMSKSIWENSFKPVDDAIVDTSKYYRSKWRVLLAEYMQVHCSKPWVVLSVIPALMLLILTFIQVFCAFYPCNRIPNVH